MRKIGFYGMGNMGQAMLKGLVKAGYPGADLVIYNRHGAVTKELAKEYGVTPVETPEDLVKESQVILFAVKPAVLPGVLQSVAPYLTTEQSLISVAAGISLAQLEALLSAEHKLFRVMPNTPALVGEGMSAIAHNESVTPEEVAEVLGIFNSFGKAAVVAEKLIDAVVGVAGSAPAYVYLFIEALADGGVAEGMPREMAYEFAAQTVLGSAQMVLETQEHPGALKDMVTSPGGTTIAAVKELEDRGFRSAVINAVQVAAQKNREMGSK